MNHLLGYRVRTSDGFYVRRGTKRNLTGILRSDVKQHCPPLERPAALRLLADWLDCGNEGKVVAVHGHVRLCQHCGERP